MSETIPDLRPIVGQTESEFDVRADPRFHVISHRGQRNVPQQTSFFGKSRIDRFAAEFNIFLASRMVFADQQSSGSRQNPATPSVCSIRRKVALLSTWIPSWKSSPTYGPDDFQRELFCENNSRRPVGICLGVFYQRWQLFRIFQPG